VARTGLPLPDGTTSHTMKRADLYQAIRDEATTRGIPIEHGKRLVDAEPAGDGVRALFEDGTDATGDVLIGADGVHSTPTPRRPPTSAWSTWAATPAACRWRSNRGAIP
jgi:FAD-dependent urate hydroxylase